MKDSIILIKKKKNREVIEEGIKQYKIYKGGLNGNKQESGGIARKRIMSIDLNTMKIN